MVKNYMKDILKEALEILQNVQNKENIDIEEFQDCEEKYSEENFDIQTDDPYGDTSSLLEKAIFLHRNKDYTDALQYYDKLLSIEPEDTLVMAKKGLALFHQGKKEEAVKWYDRVLNIDPEDEHVLEHKMWALISLYKFDKAIFYCDKLLAMRPDDSIINYMKTFCLSRKGKYEEIILLCDEMLSLNPHNIIFIITKMNCLKELGKKEDSEECQKQLVKAVNDREKEQNDINKCYFSLDDFDSYVIRKLGQDEYWYKHHETFMITDEKENKEREKKLADFRRLYGVTWEKAKKIDFITSSCSITRCSVSPDEAKKVLEENNYDTDKASEYIEKHRVPGDLSEAIEYVMKRTKVSEEEVRKVLEECYYDEIEAVMTIKKEQRKKRIKKEKDEIYRLCGDSEEKAEKIYSICTSCSISHEDAKKALEENDYDETKTFINIKKHSDLSKDIAEIIDETGVSEEEAKKALEENGYKMFRAVVSIKDKKEAIEAAEQILKKKKTI
jgi:NACalpha-BTF3-like transcription factor